MHDSAEIRQATPVDLAHVEAIVRDAYAVYIPRLGREPSTMQDDYRAHIDAGSLWVAELDRRIVGLLVLHMAADHLYLDNVAVDPAQQRLGVGRCLIAFAEDRARGAGLPEIRLTTNPHMTENLEMYGYMGFEETARTEEGRLAFVHLRKRL